MQSLNAVESMCITRILHFFPADTTSISSSNLVSTSLFMAEGLDASSGTSLSMSGWTGPHFSAAHPSNAYSSPHLQLPTPDSSPRLYPYYPHPCNPPVSTSQLAPPLPPMRDFFVCGSSLDESPISSPGDLERDTVQPTATPATGDIGAALRKLGFSNRSPSSLSRFGIAAQTSLDSGSSGEDDASTNHSDRTVQQVPDGIKMPQSKFIPVITHIVIIIIIITTIVLLTTDNDHLPHSFYPLRKRRHATLAVSLLHAHQRRWKIP